MALKWRKRVILAKIETTYGTDAVPTGAANAIQVSNLSITPLEVDSINRDLVGKGLGGEVAAIVGKRVKVEYDVEMAGAGAAGTAPAWGPVMRGCAMAETITAGVDVQYDPVDANEESVTQYFHVGSNKHPLLGARGSWGYRLNAKGYPYLHFTFIGLFAPPSDAVFPTPVFGAFVKPVHVGNANTTFSLHGYAAKLAQLSYDHKNEVVHRDLVGVEDVQVVDRTPDGSVTIEAPAIIDKDFFADVTAETLAAMQVVQGTTAGNIVQIDHPQVQLVNPQYGETDSFTTLQMGLNVIPNVGNDETKITVK